MLRIYSLQFDSFEMSDRSDAATTTPVDTVDSLCDASGVQVDPPMLQDFLMIPRATYNQMPRTVATFFCGTVLDKVTIEKCKLENQIIMDIEREYLLS